MSRAPARFRQADIARVLRAAKAAGFEVSGVEVDPVTGKITITTVKTGGEKPVDENEWDKVL